MNRKPNPTYAARLNDKLKRGTLSRREFLRLSALMGVSYGAGHLLAACAPPATAVPPTAAPAATQAPAATATTGPMGTGVAKQLINAEFADIDPGLTSRANDSVVVLNVYDALFRFNGWQRVNWLCEDYAYSNDNKTVTLKIREGVPFHDGTEMKASDVVFSMVRMLDLKGPTTILWTGVVEPDSIQQVDDYSFSITTAQPYGPLLDSLAWMWVLNEKLVREHVVDDDYGKAWLRTADAGSGPFKITVLREGEIAQFERFAEYWNGWPARYLDGFEMQTVREPATRQLLMEQGEAHVIDVWALDANGHERLRDMGLTTLYDESRPSITNIMMHNQKYPTNNKDFRKACAYAFDYDANIQGLQNGRADYAMGCLPTGYNFVKSYEGSDMFYRRDLDRARFHLAESGYDPNDASNDVLKFNAREGIPAHADLGLLLQSSLREIGINLELEFVTLPEFQERQRDVSKGECFARISYSGLTAAPDQYCTALFHSGQWANGGWFATMQWYKNDRVDEILDTAKVSVDETQRQTLFEELQDTVYDDAPSIWIDQIRHLTSTSGNLVGYQDLPLWATPIDYRVLGFEA